MRLPISGQPPRPLVTRHHCRRGFCDYAQNDGVGDASKRRHCGLDPQSRIAQSPFALSLSKGRLMPLAWLLLLRLRRARCAFGAQHAGFRPRATGKEAAPARPPCTLRRPGRAASSMPVACSVALAGNSTAPPCAGLRLANVLLARPARSTKCGVC